MISLFPGETGLFLAAPWFLLLAVLVPVAFLLRRRRGGPAVLFGPARFLRDDGETPLPRSFRARLLLVPPALAALALLLLVVALARPVRRVPIPETTEGIDIVLCIDTSSSMAANDLDPERTRLDLAKAAAEDFIAGRPDDRIGLVSFARYPDLRCPPTLDHGALGRILTDVTLVENEGPEDATGIGTAVARSVKMLVREEAKSRVIILLTDGEENVATAETPKEIAPLHAGQLSRRTGVRVYAIAAGLGRRDSGGQWAAIDTRQVRRLAEATGGRFFTARDAGAVAAVYGEIDALEKVEFAETRYRREERFVPFLAAAVLLLLLSRFLSTGVLAVRP